MRGRILFLASCVFLPALGSAASGEISIAQVYSRIKEAATRKSFEIRTAQASVNQANARHYTAVSRWFPSIDLLLSQSHSRDFSVLTSGALGELGVEVFTPETVSLSRWEFVFDVPVYRRSVQVGVQQRWAEKELEQSRLYLRKTEVDWKLHELLGDYLLQRYRQATLQNSIDLAKTNRREAELRFDLGQKTKVDVLRARANVISLESQRILYEQQVVTALSELMEFSGLSRGELQSTGLEALMKSEDSIFEAINRFSESGKNLETVQTYLKETPGKEEAVTSGVVKQVVHSSEVYRSFLAEEEVNIANARSVTAQEYPEVSFQGSLSKQSLDWARALESGNRSYSVALLVKIPLFSGGSGFSNRAEKKNASLTSALKTEKEIMDFGNQLEADRIQILSLVKALEAQKLNREQNEEILRLAIKSYQLGKGTMVELLDSQDDLIASKVDLAKTKLDLAVAIRRFAWNLGLF